MTIKEIQELVGFVDEKCGGAHADGNSGENDIFRRFCEVVRDANAAGIDLTESFAEWAGKKKARQKKQK